MSVKVRKAKKKIDWEYVTSNPGFYQPITSDDCWLFVNDSEQVFYFSDETIEVADESVWEDSEFRKVVGSVDITIEGEDE